jgi:murein DD-endopeptidase MepM/ murein hydrolase activator NlpD
MLKPVVGVGLVTLFFGPASFLLALGVLLNPAAQASCLPGTTVAVVQIPDHLSANTADGTRVTLGRSQLERASTVIAVGGRTNGVGFQGIKVALVAALNESSLRMLSNSAAYPESASLPNDGAGSDHDSLGMFQMRPSFGWGTVHQLMDPDYQARAFFGGATGPNHGSPRGLLDIRGWQQMSPGAAAQAVEESAHPDRYGNYEPVAEAIVRTLTKTDGTGGESMPVSESSRVLFPLRAGTWQRTGTFGSRADPVTGEPSMHTGVDYAAPAATPVLAVADGRVVSAGPVSSGYANLILIQHTIDGRTVVSGYAHMYAGGIHVRENQTVTAGQHIADVGGDGRATGPHLHFEIRPGGRDGRPIDPEPWLASERAAANLPTGSAASQAHCDPAASTDAAPYGGADPDQMVDDPTSSGEISARTADVLAQVRTRFPSTSWACWRRGDSRSEHPDGRACDGTFGNSIGDPATRHTLTLGWQVTNWLKANARTLGVEYVIWQGRIWSLARAAEGWRPYDGGGMHAPYSVTGGHFDHLHWTAVE